MKPKDAATYLGVSVSWLAQLRMGTLSKVEGPPYGKLGRVVRYKKADLDAWLAARTHTTILEHEAAAQ